MSLLHAANLNGFWGGLIVEELCRQQITRFYISPGSRSTPLTLAVASHPEMETTVCVDERGAAYAALGHARATGRPAVLICTSGTAVANYFPAVIEASMDCVPMLLLTADRPPELRETGANQTIRQTRIYGDYMRWFFELPCPDERIAPEVVLTTVDQAVHATLRSPAGPVHLNCLFREPLAPAPDAADLEKLATPVLRRWLAAAAPFTTYPYTTPRLADDEIRGLAQKLRGRQGLLIAGRLSSAAECAGVLQLAERLAWPVFPDVLSGLRCADSSGVLIPHYDLLLLSPELRQRFRPEIILQLGARLTSKRLLDWLKTQTSAQYILVDRSPQRHDPNHRVVLRIEADIAGFCNRLAAELAPATAPAHALDFLHAESQRVDALLATSLQNERALCEPAVARMLSRELPGNAGLFLASSQPVRETQMFAVSRREGMLRVAANRGASGIDGTLASAVGFAGGLRQPVVLLTGDLALLHDLNSLALLRAAQPPVLIVLLNNDGGGIFSFLPIAAFAAHFEKYFATPHGLSFAPAAEMFGLAYEQPESLPAFEAALRKMLHPPRAGLIEVKTNRAENHRLQMKLQEKISAALG